MIEVRVVERAELGHVADIDRTEHITRRYRLVDGALVEEAVDRHMAPWPLDDSPRGVPAKVASYERLLDDGAGMVVGAWDGARLAGFAVLRYRLDGTRAQLVMLQVSNPDREQGIGTRLMREVLRLARESGATELYVSAGPPVRTVEFYKRFGLRPTAHPHPELYALEPEDIHLTMKLPEGGQGGN